APDQEGGPFHGLCVTDAHLRIDVPGGADQARLPAHGLDAGGHEYGVVVTVPGHEPYGFAGLREVLRTDRIAHIDPGGVDHLEDREALDQGEFILLDGCIVEPGG